MTTYGTIPTSSSPSTNVEFISSAKQRIKAGLGTRRPWKVMLNFRSFGIPGGIQRAMSRIRVNIGYFRMNYAIVVLFILFLSVMKYTILEPLILFLSLLRHAMPLISFVVLTPLWLFLYFLRDRPLVIAGRLIHDLVILIVMSVLTIILLFLTNPTLNIVVALLIGAAFLVVHAVFRRTDDLFLDEEASRLMPNVAATGASSS